MRDIHFYIILLFLSIYIRCDKTEDVFELQILHNNDMRSRLYETILDERKIGGYARVSRVVNEARKAARDKAGPPVLYLNAGDIYTDRIWRNLYTRKLLIEFTNQLKPDVASFGCHNFLDDIELLQEFAQQIKFPLIVSNLHFRNGTRLAEMIKPHVLLKIGWKKVGVVGYVTPKMHLLPPDSIVDFEDEVVALKRECKILKDEGVDLIIALGHSGFSTDKRIAENVEEVDVVVGGLTNTLLWNGPQPADEAVKGPYPSIVVNKEKKILLLHVYGFTKYMGRIYLKYDSNNTLVSYNGAPLLLDDSVTPDSSFVSMLNVYRQPIRDYEDENEILGESIVSLDAQNIREEESNLANLVTDSFIFYIAQKYKEQKQTDGWTDTAIALMNAGAIRKSLKTSKKNCNITRKMLAEVMPYRQHLVKINMPGSSIIECLEIGVRSNGETSKGEFLQLSGLRVIYDFSREAGKRVLQLRTKCAKCLEPTYSKIDPDKQYTIVTTVFLANGGDGHVEFKSKGERFNVDNSYDTDVVMSAIKTFGRIRPECEERIQIATPSQRRLLLGSANSFIFNLFYKVLLLLFIIFNIYIFIY